MQNSGYFGQNFVINLNDYQDKLIEITDYLSFLYVGKNIEIRYNNSISCWGGQFNFCLLERLKIVITI